MRNNSAYSRYYIIHYSCARGLLWNRRARARACYRRTAWRLPVRALPKRERGGGGGYETVGQASAALVGPRVHLARIRGPTFRPAENRRRRTRVRRATIDQIHKNNNTRFCKAENADWLNQLSFLLYCYNVII